MASFQAKTVRAENDTKKMLLFRSIPTRLGIGNSRKIAKKCKKCYRSDPFQPDSEYGIPKK